ncbi:MAG: nitroreductase family protein [Pseudorhodoplanes sp.]|nr:nitroreductase family protein [Pseudorhodoplanes sp.]
MDQHASLADLIRERFGEEVLVPPHLQGLDPLAVLAARGATRAFRKEPVDPALIRILCATALSSPTKSDLQQRDIVIVRDRDLRARLDALMPTQEWLPAAPVLPVFCGNNRRQRQIHGWRGKAFANDHLDAFFNSAIDAGIALSAFVSAAALVELGTARSAPPATAPRK